MPCQWINNCYCHCIDDHQRVFILMSSMRKNSSKMGKNYYIYCHSTPPVVGIIVLQYNYYHKPYNILVFLFCFLGFLDCDFAPLCSACKTRLIMLRLMKYLQYQLFYHIPVISNKKLIIKV